MADLRPPLDGIRVVDLTSYIAGSYAATMLADMGADVLKIESPGGDSFRELPGFHAWNRGKRSVCVDLKAPDGVAIVQRLVRRHFQYTRSRRADEVLRKWDDFAPRFVKVFPKDLKLALDARLRAHSGDG